MATESDSARVNEYLYRIGQLISSSNPHILNFDCTVGDLRPWFWPITDDGQRVTPEDLASYRASGFRRPCCLCAVPGRNGASQGYTESVVIQDVGGEHAGQFMLTCAREKCAYKVPIDGAYVAVGLPLKRYARLPKATGIALSRNRRMRIGRTKRGGLTTRGIDCRPPPATDDSPSMTLLRLNSFLNPGLPEDEFLAMFTKCQECRWIMTRRAFKFHICPRGRSAVEVIDLTMDGED